MSASAPRFVNPRDHTTVTVQAQTAGAHNRNALRPLLTELHSLQPRSFLGVE